MASNGSAGGSFAAMPSNAVASLTADWRSDSAVTGGALSRFSNVGESKAATSRTAAILAS